MEESGGENAKDIAAAPMADMAVGASATPSTLPLAAFPPVSPPASCKAEASGGAACTEHSTSTTNCAATAAVVGSSPVPDADDELEVAELQKVAGRHVDSVHGKEESVEDLLGSLMRTLNTEQGRADFRLLAASCDNSG